LLIDWHNKFSFERFPNVVSAAIDFVVVLGSEIHVFSSFTLVKVDGISCVDYKHIMSPRQSTYVAENLSYVIENLQI
jgi:hypothetical protein